MSLKTIHTKLEHIKNTTSTNEKVQLLKKYMADKLFSFIIIYMYDLDMQYNVNKLYPFKQSSNTSLKELFFFLKHLSNTRGASNTDKEKLTQLASIDEETYSVVTKIINKDAKAGINAISINKAKPNFIKVLPYMRCSTEKKIAKINYTNQAIIQKKADGAFTNLFINKDITIQFITRNGSIVHQLEHLKVLIHDSLVTSVNLVNKVYHGELLVFKNGKILNRQTGNGIINQCIKGTASPEDAACVIINLWDCIPIHKFWKGSYQSSYQTRFYDTACFVHAIDSPTKVNMIATTRVNSYEEAQEFYSLVRASGGEGAIIKNIEGFWKNTSSGSDDSIKLKNIMDVELIIVSWKYGKEGTKYEHVAGSFQAETSCGKLHVSINVRTEKQRDWDWDSLIGRIAQLECEGVINSKSKEKHSLYLPRFIEIRNDKSEADSLKNLLER